jgi:hypothetical protein
MFRLCCRCTFSNQVGNYVGVIAGSYGKFVKNCKLSSKVAISTLYFLKGKPLKQFSQIAFVTE